MNMSRSRYCTNEVRSLLHMILCETPAKWWKWTELSNNHEEADTNKRKQHQTLSSTHQIQMCSWLGLLHQTRSMPTCSFVLARKIRLKSISIPKVKEVLQMKYDLNEMQLVSNTLLGWHAFTGCDTVSAFSGEGKVKPLKLMKNEKYISTFAATGGGGGGGSWNLNSKFQRRARICLWAIWP